MKKILTILTSVCLLSACATSYNNIIPKASAPTNWSLEQPWQVSHPADKEMKGPWWELFEDGVLNKLEETAIMQNSNLKIAYSRLEQAKYSASFAKASLYPQLNLNAGFSRSELSQNRPTYTSTSNLNQVPQNDLTLGLTVHYEVDFFGRVSNTVKSAEAFADQAQADYENVLLLLGTEVASDYFSLSELDSELNVVKENIDLQRKALDFVKTRHNFGIATGLDLAQQQALLDTTITQVDALERQRAEIEHALATLTGVASPEFKIAQTQLPKKIPLIPVAIPSTILERRPDVASAERAMAAQNAQIGVAKAAFYPSITLNPMIGIESSALSTLAQSSSLLWSLGVSVLQPIFDAGRNRANLNITESGYRASIENYKLTVLKAMQEVEDGLTGSLIMNRSSDNVEASIKSATKVLDLANARYEGGIGNYLDVISAQQSLNLNQRQSVQVKGQQLQIAVYLIKAVGGNF